MRILKRIVLSIIVFILIFSVVSFVNVYADTTTPEITAKQISVNGASVRKNTFQGLRFEGRITGDYNADNVKEYGILLAYGKISTPNSIIINKKIGDYDILKCKHEGELTSGKSNGIPYKSFYIVLYNIPTDKIEQDITARAYVILNDGNDTIIYAPTVTTRNLCDVARTDYNRSSSNDTEDNIVSQIASNKKIKITSSAGQISYVNTLDGLEINPGDTIDIGKGTYSNELTIDESNVTINGVYAGILATGSTRNKESFDENLETTFSNPITIGDGVSNVMISGLKFTGDSALILDGSQSNITFKYNKCYTTGTISIKDTDTDGTHTNISILKNKFFGSNTSAFSGILLNNSVFGMSIDSNSFESANSNELINNEYSVKINKVTSDEKSYINIYGNTFKQKSANYIVDIGDSNSTSSRVNGIINIESNSGIGKDNGNEFLGNGFKVSYLHKDATLNFVYNTNLRFSRYYNAILFSANKNSNSTTLINTSINILYNNLYGDGTPNISNPGRTTTLNTNYINIGLGFNANNTNIVINYNYFNGSARGYFFANNSSKSATTNTYASSKIEQTNAYSSDGTNYALKDYKNSDYYALSTTWFEEIKKYNDSIEKLPTEINAYYNGESEKSIAEYLLTFDAVNDNKLEIKNGKLVYVGDNLQEQLTAARISIFKASSVKTAQ